jgi:DNA-binding LytR/AlgR family response regulator
MKVLIIEDEALIAKNLQRLLGEVADDVEVLAVTGTIAATVRWLRDNPAPDLLFMDIQLSDGVSFDILAQVQVLSPIIFTTAYDEYAIRAFKHNSLDYLLKPIDRDELKTALDKFRRIYGHHTDRQSDIVELISMMTSKKTLPAKERFLVHHGLGLIPVRTEDISYFCKDQIIYLMATDGQKYVTDYNTLDEIEELTDPASFYRANRQTLVSKTAVASLQKHFTGKIEIKAKGHDMTIDISREKAQDFKNWLENN